MCGPFAETTIGKPLLLASVSNPCTRHSSHHGTTGDRAGKNATSHTTRERSKCHEVVRAWHRQRVDGLSQSSPRRTLREEWPACRKHRLTIAIRQGQPVET